MSNAVAEQCEHCKKPISREGLSVRFLVLDALNQLFNLDRGLIFTLLEMLRRPQAVIMAFVEGNRFRYMNPFRLLLISATLAVIVDAITGSSELIGAIAVRTEGPNLNQIRDNMDLIIIAMVPLFALGTFLVFRKPKWNYAEHLAINAYGLSTITIFGALLSLLAMPFSDQVRLSIESSSQFLNLFMVYLFVKTWDYGWIKSFLLLVLSYFVTIFAVAVFVFISVFIKKMI